MGMSFIGSYSGIDQNTIDQLMEAERMPLKNLANKKVSITEKQNAWKDVNTRLNSLFEKMKALKTASSFNTKVAQSSNDNYVTMDAGNSAAEGRYEIEVKQLATNTSIVGKKVEAENLSLKPEAQFTIVNGEGKETIIDVEGSASLKDVAEKINLLTKDSKDKSIEGTGISATVIDGRLVLNDEEFGEREIKLVGDGKGTLINLGLNVTKTIDSEGAGIKIGSQAKFNLNGIEIERSSNRITDAIDGIVINLNKTHETGQSETVNISSDTEKAAQTVQDFVDQYNSTMKFIEEKTAAGDPEIAGSKGSLAGESSLIRLQTSLRAMVTGRLKVEGSSIEDASQIGISTVDRFGELKFDKAKFLEELGKDKDNVTNFFNPKDGLGLVDKVNDYIDGFISKSNGIIKSKNESFEKSLKDLNGRIESFEERMERKEAYYVKTFTALDVAMMKAEDQMGWLIGQIDSMNAGRR